MSYSHELFNYYELIYFRFQGRIKELKEFIELLNLKYNLELNYSNGINAISEYKINTIDDNTISQGIVSLKNFFYHKHSYLSEFLSSIEDDVLNQLKEKLREFSSKGNTLNEEFRKSERLTKETLDKLEKVKNKYYINKKLEDEHKFKIEELKFLNITEDQKNKVILKAEEIYKEAKDYEVSYIYHVDYTNNICDKHNQILKFTLNEFQKIEETYCESVKDALRRFNIYQVALIRNLQYDLEKQGKSNEMMDSKNDLSKFIMKHSQGQEISLPKKFEFIPYSPNINVSSDQKISSIFGNVKDFFNNTINSLKKNTVDDNSEEKICKEISNTIQFIWEGNILPLEKKIIVNKVNKIKMLKYLREKKYRNCFFESLNKYRTKSKFILHENTFAVLGDLIVNILDEIVSSKDYDSFRNCVTLSQTFYKITKENHKPRIFLQNAIEIHSIFLSFDFWEEVINYSIDEEFLKQNNLNFYYLGNPNDTKRRHQNLYFSQLVSFSFCILSFDLNKSKIKEFLMKLSKKYELSVELSESLVSNVDSYNKKNETEIQSKDFLEKNIIKKDNDKDDYILIKKIIDETLKEKKNETNQQI